MSKEDLQHLILWFFEEQKVTQHRLFNGSLVELYADYAHFCAVNEVSIKALDRTKFFVQIMVIRKVIREGSFESI
jgi:hypothetical protein